MRIETTHHTVEENQDDVKCGSLVDALYARSQAILLRKKTF